MKVYVEPQDDSFAPNDFAINRESKALKRFAPAGIEVVDNQKDAELVVIYAHGFRKKLWWMACKLMKNNQKYAVLQLCLRTTPNPSTTDWLELWKNAEVVWSYYDLPKLCAEDGNKADFNFHHAPLGVDGELFKETPHEKKYVVGIHSKGWSRESLRDVAAAAEAAGKRVLNFNNAQSGSEGVVEYTGNIFTGDSDEDDRILSSYYSQCKYVSGLRRIEGFELPVLEGLMCGARPICFDLPCYRQWFDGLAVFISDEGGGAKISARLTKIFSEEPKPVSEEEKAIVREKFNWQTLVERFWARVAQEAAA